MPAGTPVASIPHAAAVVPSILTAPLCPHMGAVGIARGLPSEHRRGSWGTKGLILGRTEHKAHHLHLRMEVESAALKGSGILKTQPLFHQNHNTDQRDSAERRDGEVPISIITLRWATLQRCAWLCHHGPWGWGPAGAVLSPLGSPHRMGIHIVHPHCPMEGGPTLHNLVVQKHCKPPPGF